MKTLVTGGAGFIGSHLVERLLKEGHKVTVIDNLSTGRLLNIEHLKKDFDLKFVEANVANYLDIEKYFKGIDWIFHLACPASPIQYQENPIKTTLTAVTGTHNLLELARKNNAKFFLASTSEIYGNPKENPQVESYFGNVNPIGLRSCYNEGKRCGESLVSDYHRKYGLGVRIGRIFNTYGPRLARDDGRVISNFIIQALEGSNLTIYGDGLQTRSFCYIDDMVEGIIRLMNHEVCVFPVNLGNPEEICICELGRKIIGMTNHKLKPVFEPLPSDDPIRRVPDISLARKILNWEPEISLEKGLKRVISYFAETNYKRTNVDVSN